MKTWLTTIVVVGLSCGTVFAVTGESSTWEGSYEADALPSASGFTAEGDVTDSSSVSGGILTMDSTGLAEGFWEMANAGFDFTDGFSLEYRARVLSADAEAAAGIFISDGPSAANAVHTTFTLGSTSIGGSIVDMTQFHVVRLTIDSTADVVNMFVDNTDPAFLTGSIAFPGPINGLRIGDFTGPDNAIWEIDYVRWTDADAFDLPLDSLVGDLNGDGFVGIEDLNIVLGEWNAEPPTNPAADPTDDGFVGIEDLNVVLGNWNAGTPPAATVPEPVTAAVIAIVGSTLLRRNRSS